MVGKIQLSTVAVALAASASVAARPTYDAVYERDLVNDEVYGLYARTPASHALKHLGKDAVGHIPDVVDKINTGLGTKRAGEAQNHRHSFLQDHPVHQSSSHKSSSGGALHKMPSIPKMSHGGKSSVSGEVGKLVASKKPWGDHKKRDLYEALYERDLINDEIFELFARTPASHTLKHLGKDAVGHIPDVVDKINTGLGTKRAGEAQNHRHSFLQDHPVHQSSSHKSSGGALHKMPSIPKLPHHEKPSVSHEVNKLVAAKRPFGRRDLEDALYERDLVEDEVYELFARTPAGHALKHLGKEAVGHIPDVVDKINTGLSTKRAGEAQNHRHSFLQDHPVHQSSSHKSSSGSTSHKMPSVPKMSHGGKSSVSGEVGKLVSSKKPWGDHKKRDLSAAVMDYLVARALELEELD